MPLLHVGRWQVDHEVAPPPGLVLAVHRAAVALRDRLHQRQPQADAALALAGARQAVERLENALAPAGGTPGPRSLTRSTARSPLALQLTVTGPLP